MPCHNTKYQFQNHPAKRKEDEDSNCNSHHHHHSHPRTCYLKGPLLLYYPVSWKEMAIKPRIQKKKDPHRLRHTYRDEINIGNFLSPVPPQNSSNIRFTFCIYIIIIRNWQLVSVHGPKLQCNK
jgi:hypothetical protein